MIRRLRAAVDAALRLMGRSVDAVLRSPARALMILAGVGALLGSVAVFLGASEDVVRDNGAARLDSSRLNWFTQHRSVALVDASKFINTAAGLAVMIVLAAFVGVFLWRRGLPLAVCVAPFASVALAEVLAAIIKSTVGRSRPPIALRLVNETEPSFPSGHATAAAAFGISVAIILTVFVLRRRWTRVVTLLAGFILPVVIGLSRLELGVHWPTDVVAGLALGSCAALATSALAIWIAHNGVGRFGDTARPRFVARAVRSLEFRRGDRPALAAA